MQSENRARVLLHFAQLVKPVDNIQVVNNVGLVFSRTVDIFYINISKLIFSFTWLIYLHLKNDYFVQFSDLEWIFFFLLGSSKDDAVFKDISWWRHALS